MKLYASMIIGVLIGLFFNSVSAAFASLVVSWYLITYLFPTWR